MRWFLGLRLKEETKWAVEEAYEMHGMDRVARDVELVANALK